MFGSEGGLGKPISDTHITVFRKGTITINGVEISLEQAEVIRQDSAAKLLRSLEIRKEENKRIAVLKKEKEERDAAIAKKRNEMKKQKAARK